MAETDYGTTIFQSGVVYSGVALDLPSIVSALPAAGGSGVAQDAEITFTLQAALGFDVLSLNVNVNNRQAISGGAFQPGWTGTVDVGVDDVVVTIMDHPLFETEQVFVLVDCFDLHGPPFQIVTSWRFTVSVGQLQDLTAKTWCEGKRIDLSWTNPEGITALRVYRSQFSYLEYETDPGTLIHDGAIVSSLSDTGLEEGVFYYYSVFISYTEAAPYRFITSDRCKVQGLSIKDYAALHEAAGVPGGRYVYNLLPRDWRREDGLQSRGDDRYRLRDICDFIQCSVNLYRGWAEALVIMKDPDRAPLGRLGVAENQFGIMSAYVADLGVQPERAFDAAVLRRLVLGITYVHLRKGTCPGLVALARILTTWTVRCAQANEAVCGINRLFRVWDGESQLLFVEGKIGDGNYSPVVELDATVSGQLRVDENYLYNARFDNSGFTPHTLSGTVVAYRTRNPETLRRLDAMEAHDGEDVVTVLALAGSLDATTSGDPEYDANYEVLDNGRVERVLHVNRADSVSLRIQDTAGSAFVSGNDATFVFVLDLKSMEVNSLQTLLSIENAIRIHIRTAGSHALAFTDSGGTTVLTGAELRNGLHVIVVTLSDAGELNAYINGKLAATDTWVPGASLANDRVRLFAAETGATQFMSAEFMYFQAIERVITPTELAAIWAHFSAGYQASYGPTLATPPETSEGEPTVVGILTALGDFTCVSDVTLDGGEWVFTFADDDAYIRAEILGEGTAISTFTTDTFVINSIDTASYPWQYPLPADEPRYGLNAFKGLRILDSDGNVAIITGSEATDGSGDTLLYTDVLLVTGAFSISSDFDRVAGVTFATRRPRLRMQLIIGEFSFTPHLIWDNRLQAELATGPWSFLTGLSSNGGLAFAPSIKDVTLYVENQDELIGQVTGAGEAALIDDTMAWEQDEWAGYYLLPNWDQTRTYLIAGNSSNTLYVTVDGPGINDVAEDGSTYVILREDNTRKYSRLVNMIKNFVPDGSRPFVKFEEVPESFLMNRIIRPKLLGWYRSDQGIALSSGSNIQQWSDLSGNGRHFIACDAGAVTLVEPGGGVQPYLDFDGTGALELAHDAGLDLDNVSFLLVFTDLNSVSCTIIHKGQGATHNYGITVDGGGDFEALFATGGGTGPASPQAVTAASTVFLHQKDSTNDDWRIASVDTAAAVGTMATNAHPVTLGARRATNTPTYDRYTTFRLRELVIFDGPVPLLLKERIERYTTALY